MKNYILLILMVITVAFVGCKKEEGTETTTPSTNAPAK
jgi:hypothetical protein